MKSIRLNNHKREELYLIARRIILQNNQAKTTKLALSVIEAATRIFNANNPNIHDKIKEINTLPNIGPYLRIQQKDDFVFYSLKYNKIMKLDLYRLHINNYLPQTKTINTHIFKYFEIYSHHPGIPSMINPMHPEGIHKNLELKYEKEKRIFIAHTEYIESALAEIQQTLYQCNTLKQLLQALPELEPHLPSKYFSNNYPIVHASETTRRMLK